MKAVLRILGAFVLTCCIFSTDANAMETETPLNVMDLPVELRLDIFEQLDFKTLIRVSKTHPGNRNVVERVFRNVLKNNTFHVYFKKHLKKIDISYDSTEISIAYGDANENIAEILEFLQYFGHCITKLVYWYDPAVHNLCESFHNQIRKYVAESVNEIYFRLGGKSMKGHLHSLIVPYPNARVVKLRDGKIDAANLRQMFPAARSLDLELTEVEGSFHYFPYLERLTIPRDWGVNESNFPLFEQTLELNPKIKHLCISESDHWDMLQTLNKICPDLESLQIDILNFNGYEKVAVPLRFTNMKVFKCRSSAYGPRHVNRIPLEFGNLQEIEFNRADLTDHWINIVVQNKKLRKVTAFTLRRDSLKRMAAELPNLEEFTMIYSAEENGSVQEIVDFLQKANQLKKIRILELEEHECNAMVQQLNNDWKMIMDRWSICELVRK